MSPRCCIDVVVVNMVLFFFFFQAEDGIRDIGVTGVQTCALPILRASSGLPKGPGAQSRPANLSGDLPANRVTTSTCSVERMLTARWLDRNRQSCVPDVRCKIGRASRRERV